MYCPRLLEEKASKKCNQWGGVGKREKRRVETTLPDQPWPYQCNCPRAHNAPYFPFMSIPDLHILKLQYKLVLSHTNRHQVG